MRRKTCFSEHINVIAQKDFAGIVRIDRHTDESRARTERSGGEGEWFWGLRWAESGHSLEEGGAFWQTDRQAGEEDSEFGLKRPTVCFG